MAQAKVTLLLDMKSRLGGLNSAIGRVKALGSTLTRAILPLAGVGSVAGIGAGIRNIIGLGAQMDHLRAQTGANVAGLLTLRQAFSDSGVEASTVGKTINDLQRRLTEASRGTGESRRALRGMNLEVRDLQSLSPEQQFEILSERLAGIENPAERTAAAIALFGKSGAELIPVLATGLDDARRALGRMPEVLQRNATEFERIDTLIGRIPNKSRQLFAGLGDQLAGYLRGPLERLNEIDLTGMGQRIGAYISLGLDSIRDGTFGQFISLGIRAGFEIGMERVQAGAPEWFKAFAGHAFSAIATLGIEISKLLIEAFSTPIAALASAFQWVWDHASNGAKRMALRLQNFLLDAFLKSQVYNPLLSAGKFAEMASNISQVQLDNLRAIKETESGVKSIGERYAENRDAMAEITDMAGNYLDNGLREGLTILGLQTREMTAQVSAAQQLNALIQARLDKRDAETAGAGSASGAGMGGAGMMGAQSFADRSQERYDQFQGGEGDFGVGTWRAAKAGFMDYITTVGTFGQQIYESIGTIAQGLSGGISESIQGLINGTMTWGDALRNIASTFVNSIISAFSEMAAQFIVKRTMMFLLNRKLDAGDAASNVAKNAVIATSEATTAGVTAAAWTPAAILKSIATFGAAALIGIAILGAVMGGGFAEGGYTGPGGKHQPAGIVHAGEFVFPAHVVDQIGVENLYRMMVNPASGYSEGGAVGIATPSTTATPGTTAARPVSVIVVDSRRQAERMMDDPDVEFVVMDILDRNKADFFA